VGRTPDTIDAAAAAVTSTGGHAVAIRCDIADASSVKAMTQEVSDRLGPVDVLVNNAAIYPERPWTEITEDEWDRVLATNLKAFFLCARAVYAGMSDRGFGRIINLTSTTFFYGFPNATVLDYVTSKGGIIGFTRALSREIGPTGITVNAIAPGAFEPPPPDPDYNRWVLDRQSLKRRGVGADVGNVAAFLASEAAAFITGQTIAVDGGMVTN
jgi:3-oxoacyl-[acyl-carrier protein] reductase